MAPSSRLLRPAMIYAVGGSVAAMGFLLGMLVLAFSVGDLVTVDQCRRPFVVGATLGAMGGVLVFGTIRLSPRGFRNYPTAVLAGAFVALAAPFLFALFLIVPPSAPLVGVAADYLSDAWPYGLWGGAFGAASNWILRQVVPGMRPRGASDRPADPGSDPRWLPWTKGMGPGRKGKGK